MNTALRFTYQDYLQLPEDRRYEIVDGDLYIVPAPIPYHQKVSRNLEFQLHQHVQAHDLGEVFDAPCEVLLSKTDVVQPDILFISQIAFRSLQTPISRVPLTFWLKFSLLPRKNVTVGQSKSFMPVQASLSLGLSIPPQRR